MGFWHTGYAEFHELSGLDGFIYSPPPPPRFSCEQCAADFSDLETLRRHRFESHPLRQPALLLCGRPAGAVPSIIVKTLRQEDVAVEDTLTCLVSGQGVDIGNLGEVLSKMTHEFVNIELLNGGSLTRCALDFRIAPEGDLVGVEREFLRLVEGKSLTLETVGRFACESRVFGGAMSYCDGICHYLYGVMAKENSPESGLHHSQYVSRFIRANDELSRYDRPLARNIRAQVAFHFNHFEDAAILAPEGALLNTARAFRDLLRGDQWPSHSMDEGWRARSEENLLTDQDTLQLLADACHSLPELGALSDTLHTRLQSVRAGYDRLKRVLLLGEALAAQRNETAHRSARRLAQEFATQTDTARWAAALQDRMKTV